MGKQGSLLKRLTDIIISLFALFFSLPLLLIVAIAIKLDSKGPVFFMHERSGLNGKPFKLYKFRGMVNNALEIGPELTQENDPRVTRVGRLLRRTSIDEIPNFINVLKGEMSVIGPRPEILSITSEYSQYQKLVFKYKPGVTGISQVNGRQMLTPEQRVNMEIDYYDKATFWSDFKVLLATVMVVLNNKGNV